MINAEELYEHIGDIIEVGKYENILDKGIHVKQFDELGDANLNNLYTINDSSLYTSDSKRVSVLNKVLIDAQASFRFKLIESRK